MYPALSRYMFSFKQISSGDMSRLGCLSIVPSPVNARWFYDNTGIGHIAGPAPGVIILFLWYLVGSEIHS